jgi:hypothetical protein
MALGESKYVEGKKKRTSIGGGRVKRSSMNKAKKRSYKKYNRQGR